MPATLDGFLTNFVLPLVAGGELRVSRPLGAGSLAKLYAEAVTPDDAMVRIEAARQRRAAQLWLHPVPTPWDETSIRLAVGLHNLLFLGHPHSRRWTAGRAGLEKVARVTRQMLALDPPRTEEQAVERHTLAERIFELRRTDVEIGCWTGKQRFQGMTPPSRLTRWRRVRRVKETRRVVTWFEEALSETQLELLPPLLRASPLTDVLSPARPRPPFVWLDVAAYLRWPRLARLVCHRYLETGLDAIGPALAGPFWALVARPTRSPQTRATLRLVATLVLYLYATSCLLDEPKLPPVGDDPSASLSSVLLAATECGLVPPREALACGEVETRVQKLAAAAREQLSPGWGELTAKLRAAME